MKRALSLILLGGLFCKTLHATQPAAEAEHNLDHSTFLILSDSSSRDWPAPLGPFSYMREFDQIIHFLADWQQLDPFLPHYGGMIEAEAGDLGGVIQTDNTLEAIWCWSRWRQLTGRDDMDNHVNAAWVYCNNYPAWMEEGGTDEYYRNHNSAWGLAACDMYEAATADTSYRQYARNCAAQIAAHPMPLYATSTINAFVTGWCAGSLYEYALYHEDEELKQVALDEAERLYDWIMVNPATRLALNDWAMSSGTMLWGLSASLFREQPLLAMNWHFSNAFHVPEWAHWANLPGYDWDSSWNVAYANGLFELAQATGDPEMLARARRITDGLLSWDIDDDGGIMADTSDPPTEDMSWVSCYLARFCLARELPTSLPAQDAAILRLHDLVDEMVLQQAAGVATPTALILVGEGRDTSADVAASVFLDGNELASWTSTLASASLDTLSFDLPADMDHGRHLLEAWISTVDDNQQNDTLRLHFWIPPETPVCRITDRRFYEK